MTFKDFSSGLKSRYFWLNITAMVVVVVAIIIATFVALGLYTHHGEEISVPNLRDMQINHAETILEHKGLVCVVTDSGFVRGKPVGCILLQSPEPGSKVKEGRTIYVTINSGNSPTMMLPDIADNSSMREAQAKLSAMGFKLGKTEFVEGEKDWVIAVKVRGRKVFAGDRIATDAPITLVVGDGTFSDSEDISTETDPFTEDFDLGDIGELISTPSATTTTQNATPSTTEAARKSDNAKKTDKAAPATPKPQTKTTTKKKDTDDSWF